MNKNLLSKLFIFTAGAAIGSVVTWKIVKTKYEQIAQEEIESVRELYYGSQDAGEERDSDTESDDEDPDESLDEADYDEYEDLIKSAGYVQYQKDKMEEKEEEDEMIDPYVIIPEEFDENGYETVTLYYFEDGVVTDVSYEVIDNVDELIGEDSLNHFGEYEKDTVFVRNDNLETDFEIQRDSRRFSEVE